MFLYREVTANALSKLQGSLILDETEKLNIPQTFLSQNNDKKDSSDKVEELFKSQELVADNKVKRRARIMVKPNFASKSLTQLPKPKVNSTDDRSILSSIKNQNSLPTSPPLQQLPPKIKFMIC